MSRKKADEADVLRFVQSYRDANQYSPCYREISEGIGVCLAVVHKLVSRTVDDGRMARLPIPGRNLVVTEEGLRCIR